MASLAGNAVVPVEQFFPSCEQRAFVLILIHDEFQKIAVER